jgi:hypothetical protein
MSSPSSEIMSATRVWSAVNRRAKRNESTHILGQGIQVGECFEGIWFVCELLEQCRVLNGVDEIIGDLCGLPSGCSRERTERMTVNRPIYPRCGDTPESKLQA